MAKRGHEMDLPNGKIILRSGFGPSNWLRVGFKDGAHDNPKLRADVSDKLSATTFMAEPLDMQRGYFALSAIDPDGDILWLSRIHRHHTDYLEATKREIDNHCTFEYCEVQPNGGLFAVSLPRDNKQYWRLDVDNGNVIKPDAPTYLLEGGLQANKLCLFSYENL